MREKGYTFLVNLCRFILGGTFLSSGFLKTIDPLGSVYKIGDYLTAFSIDGLPTSFVEVLGGSLSIVEMVIGVLLLLGIRRRLSSTLALGLMLIMTPLTLYLALYNPVSDCGCFGDALILTNWETFYKNIILLLLVIVLYVGKLRIKRFISLDLQWIISVYTILFSFGLLIYSIRHLPILDFRPYKIGVDIIADKTIPEDAKRAVYDTRYIMEKEGVRKEFTIENYPDSSWTFIDVSQKLIEEGYEAPIKDFVISRPTDGEDITDEILNHKGYTFLLIMHHIDLAEDNYIDRINDISDFAKEKGIPFYALTASGEEDIKHWREYAGASYSIYNMDDITLKTMIRSNPGLILLKDGVIYRKWANCDMPTEEELLVANGKDVLSKDEATDVNSMLKLIAIYLIPLLLVMGIDIVYIRRKENTTIS